jgi:hypothetical protein
MLALYLQMGSYYPHGGGTTRVYLNDASGLGI